MSTNVAHNAAANVEISLFTDRGAWEVHRDRYTTPARAMRNLSSIIHETESAGRTVFAVRLYSLTTHNVLLETRTTVWAQIIAPALDAFDGTMRSL